MTDIASNIKTLQAQLPEHVTLVAVSKTKPNSDIEAAYAAGQRHFGENKVQEMTVKYEELPKDIQWHMIGHLQRNKVKYLAPYVHLIHGVDSLKLLKEINKEARKNERVIDCLLQVHIAEEDTKFGLDATELDDLLDGEVYHEMDNIRVCGLMGMATFTEDEEQIKREFTGLAQLFEKVKAHYFSDADHFDTLSMGMSGDYALAIDCGSTMVRVGSAIFGARNYG